VATNSPKSMIPHPNSQIQPQWPHLHPHKSPTNPPLHLNQDSNPEISVPFFSSNHQKKNLSSQVKIQLPPRYNFIKDPFISTRERSSIHYPKKFFIHYKKKLWVHGDLVHHSSLSSSSSTSIHSVTVTGHYLHLLHPPTLPLLLNPFFLSKIHGKSNCHWWGSPFSLQTFSFSPLHLFTSHARSPPVILQMIPHFFSITPKFFILGPFFFIPFYLCKNSHPLSSSPSITPSITTSITPSITTFITSSIQYFERKKKRGKLIGSFHLSSPKTHSSHYSSPPSSILLHSPPSSILLHSPPLLFIFHAPKKWQQQSAPLFRSQKSHSFQSQIKKEN